ncbi:MAG: NADPH-dependent F420 reductase [Ktedonobacterales bacterium]
MTAGTLTIVVLGAGNVGGTLGRKWNVAGHRVAFGVSNPKGKNAQALRNELGDQVTIDSVAAVLSTNPDVVVMALPGTAMVTTIAEHAHRLDGRIIVDAANRMGGGPMNSLATFQQHTPHARVFRAFNSISWENFANPEYDGVRADLFYCGPNDESRSIVEQMITAIGLRPMYVGGDEQVALLDAVAGLSFALAFGQGMGRHLAFKVLTR